MRCDFGDASSEWEAVKAFYDKFVDFQSQRSFSAYDKRRASTDEGRRMRRAVDQENARHRRQAKSTYQDMVRQLALFVRKRDPRVKKRMEDVARDREAKRAAAEALKLKKRQENLEARRKWREQGPVDDGYEARQGVTLADLDDKKEKATTTIYSCAACKKTFKSEKQYANHCLSKAHKKKAGSSRRRLRRRRSRVSTRSTRATSRRRRPTTRRSPRRSTRRRLMRRSSRRRRPQRLLPPRPPPMATTRRPPIRPMVILSTPSRPRRPTRRTRTTRRRRRRTRSPRRRRPRRRRCARPGGARTRTSPFRHRRRRRRPSRRRRRIKRASGARPRTTTSRLCPSRAAAPSFRRGRSCSRTSRRIPGTRS